MLSWTLSCGSFFSPFCLISTPLPSSFLYSVVSFFCFLFCLVLFLHDCSPYTPARVTKPYSSWPLLNLPLRQLMILAGARSYFIQDMAAAPYVRPCGTALDEGASQFRRFQIMEDVRDGGVQVLISETIEPTQVGWTPGGC